MCSSASPAVCPFAQEVLVAPSEHSLVSAPWTVPPQSWMPGQGAGPGLREGRAHPAAPAGKMTGGATYRRLTGLFRPVAHSVTL